MSTEAAETTTEPLTIRAVQTRLLQHRANCAAYGDEVVLGAEDDYREGDPEVTITVSDGEIVLVHDCGERRTATLDDVYRVGTDLLDECYDRPVPDEQ